MKERPILMRGPLVVATLGDAKWQTRRVVRPQFGRLWGQGVRHGEDACSAHVDIPAPDGWRWLRCPYGKAGDRLWVRETWQINHVLYDRGPIPKARPIEFGEPVDLLYRADGEFCDQFEIDEGGSVWRPPIHMPRWASRLTLEITAVRVERLQDIDNADICAELGYPLTWNGDGPEPYPRNLRGAFTELWDATTTNPAYRWAANPWVWVLSYRRVV